MKTPNIEDRIKNLKKALLWKENECEQSRLSLVSFAGKCTAEEIAHGCLNQDVKSLRDQIALLELILGENERGK